MSWLCRLSRESDYKYGGGEGGGVTPLPSSPHKAYDKIFDDDVAILFSSSDISFMICTRVDFYLFFILCFESINSRPIGSEAEDT